MKVSKAIKHFKYWNLEMIYNTVQVNEVDMRTFDNCLLISSLHQHLYLFL